jgi:hypothetical protein
MRTIVLTFTILASAAQVRGGQHVDPAGRGYDVPTLLQQQASLIGKVVTVHFNYRSEKLRHVQPSWFEASIWQHDPKARKGFSGFRVMVAKNDLAVFKSITSDFNSVADLTVVGKIETDPDNNQIYLRFLGLR